MTLVMIWGHKYPAGHKVSKTIELYSFEQTLSYFCSRTQLIWSEAVQIKKKKT